MRILQFLKQFKFNVKYKFDKEYIILNALSRLININYNKKANILKYFKFNALYICLLIKIFEEFRKCLVNNYRKNS